MTIIKLAYLLGGSMLLILSPIVCLSSIKAYTLSKAVDPKSSIMLDAKC